LILIRVGQCAEEFIANGADTVGIEDEIEILRHAGLAVRDRRDPTGKMTTDVEALQHVDQLGQRSL
jgi:hypothetical protein